MKIWRVRELDLETENPQLAPGLTVVLATRLYDLVSNTNPSFHERSSIRKDGLS